MLMTNPKRKSLENGGVSKLSLSITPKPLIGKWLFSAVGKSSLMNKS